MADVTINYKGSKIAELSASGTKTLKTSGTYCEGDISVSYDKIPESEILGDTGFLSLSIIDVTIGANTVANGKEAYDYFVGLVGTDIVAIALLNNPTIANQFVMAPGCRRKDSGSFQDYIMACRYDSSGKINATTSLYQDYNMKLVQGTKYRVWIASLFNTTNPKPY